MASLFCFGKLVQLWRACSALASLFSFGSSQMDANKSKYDRQIHQKCTQTASQAANHLASFAYNMPYCMLRSFGFALRITVLLFFWFHLRVFIKTQASKSSAADWPLHQAGLCGPRSAPNCLHIRSILVKIWPRFGQVSQFGATHFAFLTRQPLSIHRANIHRGILATLVQNWARMGKNGPLLSSPQAELCTLGFFFTAGHLATPTLACASGPAGAQTS